VEERRLGRKAGGFSAMCCGKAANSYARPSNTKPPARFELALAEITDFRLLTSAFLTPRRKDALLRDDEINSQKRHHVVVR